MVERVEHLSGYQDRDWAIVDYAMYQNQSTGLWFRGPPPSMRAGDYITCVGAAQTFGCFCEQPYPMLLQQALSCEAVNLGYGGAGPGFFLKYPGLIEIMNAGRLVILQVMSGRSESNSIFCSGGLEYLTRRADGARLSADNAYKWLLDREAERSRLPAPLARAVRIFSGPTAVRAVLHETRSNWISNYQRLLKQLTRPVVLFWFSKRRPGWHRSRRMLWWWQRFDAVGPMFGEFPQLVNASMVEAVRAHCQSYVECVTRRGLPQPFYDRFTGEPTVVDYRKDREDFAWQATHNDYYPSPEMHVDAATALLPACRQLLAGSD